MEYLPYVIGGCIGIIVTNVPYWIWVYLCDNKKQDDSVNRMVEQGMF